MEQNSPIIANIVEIANFLLLFFFISSSPTFETFCIFTYFSTIRVDSGILRAYIYTNIVIILRWMRVDKALEKNKNKNKIQTYI